ncbi:MAG: radical SAM family heme chaperone HemW [Clostridia bacterium]|nr:radical SAM family heme chaperone HemW [Clostridia bacterium]
MMTTNKLGLYIHIPFCIRKCNYCAFNSVGVCAAGAGTGIYGSTAGSESAFGQAGSANGQACDFTEAALLLFRKYTDAVKNEIDFYGRLAADSYFVDTVFIGGGTPSVIPAEYISEILEQTAGSFRLSDGAEITIECNPGTLTETKLNTYIKSGINRVSMGVQSFDDGLLRILGRIHDSKTAKESFHLLRSAGFQNINLDLMFSIPGHDMNLWKKTLDEAFALRPEHISFYSLQLEENTPFFDMFEKGELDLPSDELDRKMYHEAIAVLEEKGYEHYEISNASVPGKRCRHNLKYWSLDEYLGIGAGAHSYFAGCRFFNRENADEYITSLCGEEFSPKKESEAFFAPCVQSEDIVRNTKDDDMSEFVFTGLRKTEGINLGEFSARFGRSFFEVYRGCIPQLKEYEKNELLSLNNDNFRLTRKGIDISNSIMALFV